MKIRKWVAFLIAVIAVLLVMGPGLTNDKEPEGSRPVVLMETTLGSIKIELWRDKAPITVKNFLDLMLIVAF